ncbi:hypothetical protein [Leisingera sp. ANG-M7]|uniref:hypothetical protein n=1 Tax=Leisingera sp. ANG-M7 TaxID=1577902 RepID=UPI00057FE2F6|nr:hypothetical protein [Leisingera sp. ANG-M7]KIC39360.1 hypothetical protein RA26_01535 [Leisingera sp. ANG-M7]
MATMRDIVTRAYRKARIAGSGESLEAEQADEGNEQLNAMLHEWKLRGVDITHTDKGLSDTFPLGPEYEHGTVLLLAEAVGPEFNLPASFNADDFFRAIQAAYLTIDTVSFDKAVTEVPSKKERDGTLGYQWR